MQLLITTILLHTHTQAALAAIAHATCLLDNMNSNSGGNSCAAMAAMQNNNGVPDAMLPARDSCTSPLLRMHKYGAHSRRKPLSDSMPAHSSMGV
jgi:hypothetical protein